MLCKNCGVWEIATFGWAGEFCSDKCMNDAFSEYDETKYRSMRKINMQEDFDPYDVDKYDLHEYHTYINDPDE